MRRNQKRSTITKKDISQGIFTLGFSAVIGIAAIIYMMAVLAIAVVFIVLIALIIKYSIDAYRHKKISPMLSKLDICEESEFPDIASDIISSAFSNGYILKSDFEEGAKVINFSFIQSESLIPYDEALDKISDNAENNRGIVTNSRLSKEAASYCKRHKAHVIDRDIIIDMLLFNFKHR